MSLPPPNPFRSLREHARHALLGTGLLLALCAAAPAFGQVRVFSNGDSITFGIGATDIATRSYAPVLAGQLGPGYTVQRDGTGGATLLRRGQPSFFNTQGIRATSDANPDVITIFLGTNDSKPENWVYRDEFVGDYVSLIDTFRALPANPRIFIALPPPAAAPSPNDVSGRVIANEVLPRILEVARARDVAVVDLHTPFLDTFRVQLVDGIHPSDEGHRVIATAMRDAIVDGRHLRALPGPWQRSAVGGSPLHAGADAQEAPGGAIILYGGGAGWTGGADGFRVAHVAVNGDAEVVARLTSLRAADPASETRAEAGAGVSFREGVGADARHFTLLSTPGGLSLRWREGAGANTGVVTLSGVRPPVWLRVRRTGNNFIASYSTNGTNDWRAVGSTRTLALAPVTQAGVVAASGQTDALARARFEQVNVADLANSGPPQPPPSAPGGGRPLGARGPWAIDSGGGVYRGDREASSR